MHLEIYQIVLLTLFAFIAINESLISGTLHQPVVAGFIAGLIMGDIGTGLMVGGTLQLMTLGVAAFGGASIPDYFSGAVLGTVFAVISGQGAKFGISLAIPVSLLMLQLDIVARFCNVFLLHRIDKAIDRMEVRKIPGLVLSGSFSWGLSRAVPMLIMLLAGSAAVRAITANVPEWLMSGLKTAGGVLPVVGIAILLRYLPTKSFMPYLILGFCLVAYLKVPMMGAALIGLVAAMIVFTRDAKKTEDASPVQAQVAAPGRPIFKGGFDGDE